MNNAVRKPGPGQEVLPPPYHPEQSSHSQGPNRTSAALAKQADSTQPESAFHAGHAGEWIDAEQLRQWALSRLGAAPDTVPGQGATGDTDCENSAVTFDLSELDYLEAGALQVLLAARTAAHDRGRKLKLIRMSSTLREWFEFAGATELVEECGCTSERQDELVKE